MNYLFKKVLKFIENGTFLLVTYQQLITKDVTKYFTIYSNLFNYD